MEKLLKDTATSSGFEVDPQIRQTVADLAKQKKIYSSVNVSKLPDKGAKLKQRIDDLERILNDLSISKEKNSANLSTSIGVVHKIPEKNKTNAEIKNDIIIEGCEEPSSDSGFNEAFNASNKPLTFSKALATEKFTTFHDLNKKAPKDNSNSLGDVVNSPSFKNHRGTMTIPSIKLTEAKPLFEGSNKKKFQSNATSTTYMNSFANEETMKQLHNCMTIYPEDTEDENQPKYLTTSLMSHQIKALSWLVWREAQIPSGGILADDMGLGKTLTMIALILRQREKRREKDEKVLDSVSKGTLVVCVASVIHQWEDEINKHCKKYSLTVFVYHGPKREKQVEFMRRHDIVLTTYSILLSERKAMLQKAKESGLFQLKWERVILDEAHTIKNHSTQTAEAVFSLRSFKKWCVTGTPFHNDFKDIYSLLKFLQFYPFDDYKKFKKLTDENSKSSADRRNMLVKSILFRRTKSEVDGSGKPLIEMVKKSVSIIEIELSAEEKKVYRELDDKAKDVIGKLFRDQRKRCGSSSSMLVMLLRLQQCCSHISLLGEEAEEHMNDSVSDVSFDFSSLSIAENSDKNLSSDSKLDFTFSQYETHSLYNKSVKSTKIQKLFDELNQVSKESGNRCKSVIVSQWVSMLELVEYHLKQERIAYHMIVGSTKLEDRQSMSEDFNYNADGCKIMLLSLKAGGVGLNLNGANHLFLMDLHWNPALEMQACDRIHRVGQEKDVFIHKFVCKETIEERILALQEEKSHLASDVLIGAGRVKKGLCMEDFKTLFNVQI